MLENSLNSYGENYMLYSVYKNLLDVYMIITFFVSLHNCAIKRKGKENI
jgi:hypothetical protein